ncbi:hypothetical protein K502DRAFT_322562 [Neoconidiobolus thromboides FSU 785]|nr:hypothetical protein K502DRAFT_322562 [Neoconidiobolus thromboides FSU 785]
MVPIYPEGIVEQNKKLSLDYNEMKYNYTSLTTDYRMLKLTSERRLEKLQNQIDEKEYCINQLKQQITEKQNNNEKLEEQINELKKQVESLQEKVNSKNDKIIIDQLKDEIISLKHTISILEIQSKESQQNIELLNLQLNNKDKEFKEQIDNLESQLISKEEEITKLMKLNLELEKNQNTQVDSDDPKTLELVVKEYQVLKEKHNKLEQQYILLKKEKEFINYSQSQHLLLKESYLSLENKIKRKQDYIEEMEKTLATVNSKSIEW